MLYYKPDIELINLNLDKEAKEEEVHLQHKKRTIHPPLSKRRKVLQERKSRRVPMMQEHLKKENEN